MTKEEWLEKRCVKPDIDYLKKCGFEIEIVKNDDTRFNSEYFVYVSDGEKTEIFRRPYDIERMVNVIIMYRGLNETLLKQKDEEIKQLAKRICELQSDLAKAKIQIEKMKCCVNCQTWNEWQCPYARDKEKNYIYPNKNNCPCDKWKIKVVE